MNLREKISSGNRSLRLYAKRLAKLDIFTYRDLLYHLPSRYEDYSLVSTIGQLQAGERVTVKGQVLASSNTYTRSHKTIQKVTLFDGTGSLELIWFNQPYIVKNLQKNTTLSVSGIVEFFQKKLTIISPLYEIHNDQHLHTGRIIPIYPETAGVTSKWLRRQIALLFQQALPEIVDYLPEKLRKENNLLDLTTALQKVHFPDSLEQGLRARHRLAFDEVFFMQLAALERKKQWRTQRRGPRMTLHEDELHSFLQSLPFQLTTSQQRAVHDILNDLQMEKPMNRLLQGDVGSGKTVVAAAAMYVVAKNGYQSAMMAPTEILAQQHFATLKQLLVPHGLKVGLATSSHKLKSAALKGTNDQRKGATTHDRKIPSDKGSSMYDVIVGTHALVEKTINFHKLGFVAIDEQQRFGVEQRGILREKGENPHLLTMTATPIPRTLALTLYGELDVSYLTDMPKGRKLVKTWLVPSAKRDKAYDWIRKQIKNFDSQVFIICPFVEESENMQTVKAATKEFARLQREVFPDLKLGLLHGKLKSKEKDEILTSFRKRQFDILVATPVVEVGIDIPNATIIMIEGSERFGLAQLHQLRGRVGRGEKQSYCLLFTDATTKTALNRLKAMETMSQGAALAEFDLKMRGPGDMYGLRQSGTRMLKIASFSDVELLNTAKKAATTIFPTLSLYPNLQKKVQEITIQTVKPD